MSEEQLSSQLPNASGNWSIDTGSSFYTGTFNPNTNGTNEVSVTSTDAAGNSSSDTTTDELTIDTTTPATPTVVSQTTNDTTPTITGTATVGSGETLTVEVDGETYTAGDGNLSLSGTAWTLTIPTGNEITPDGTYDVTATVTDAAGNSTDDGTTGELIIDTVAPATPTVVSQTTNDTTPTITGTATVGSGETLTVEVDGETYTAGDGNLSLSGTAWTLTIPTGNEITPDGTYDVTATVTDAAGNSTDDGTTGELIIDTVAPATPTVVSQTTNDTTPTITGTATVGSGETLTVEVDGETYTAGDGNLSLSGTAWTLTIPTGNEITPDGTYDVTATVTDAAGNSTDDGTTGELIIDTVAPATPTVVSQTTNDTTPTITGTATVGSGETLTVEVDGETYTAGDGNLILSGTAWTLTIPTGNEITPDGTYDVTATVTDAAGNSTDDGTTGELIIDTVAPATPTVVSQTTNDTTPTITGTATVGSGETLTVEVDGETYTAGDGNLSLSGTAWTLTIPTGNEITPDGTYDVTATVTDASGNSSSDTTTDELTVDTTAPASPTVNALTTSDTSPVLTGTAEAGSTVTVVINGVTFTTTADGSGNWSVDTGSDVPTSGGPFTALGDGDYDVTVTSTDASGNSSSDTTTDELTVDTTAPASPTVNALTTSDTSPVLTGTAEAGSTITVVINGVTFTTTADSSGNWSVDTGSDVPTSGGPFTALNDGDYDVTVTSTDASGNSSSDTTTDELTIDTTAPASPTVNALTTSDTSPVLTGTAEAGSTVTVVINGVTFTTTADSSGNWSVDTGSDVPTSGGPFTALNDGDYDVTVTSTDASGNSSSDTTTDELTIDTTAPASPTVNALTTSDTSPVLTGTAEAGSTVTVVINGVTFTTTADSSGNWSVDTGSDVPTSGGPFTALNDGDYDVTVTSTDASGNSSSDTTTDELTVDTTAPASPTVNALTTSDTSPVLTGTAEAGSTITVVINGVTFTTTADSSGNWSVDTGSDVPTSGGPFTALNDGDYDVTVTSTDASGNSSSDTTTDELTVDTTAPASPTVNALTTSDTSPVLTGTAEAGSTVTVVINGVTFTTTADSSGNWSVDTGSDVPTSGGPFTALNDGDYDVTVTSTDASGNSSSDTTTDELTVDTTAPASPTVNALTTSDTSPVLTGTAEAGSTVTVVINGVTFTTTADSSGNWSVDTGSDVPTSGGPFTALNDGDYDVTVTSTDASGNSSSDTTTDELTIDTTAPASPTVNALTTSDTSPVLTGTAEAGSTVTVVINGVTFTTTADSSGNWSVDTGSDVPTSGGPFTALNDGDYDVTVTSTDASGNSSSDTTTDELTVDTTAPASPTVNALTTSDTSPVLTGTAEAGSTITVVINGVTFTTTADSSGNWSVDTGSDVPTSGGPFTALNDGDYDVTVTSTDASGNSSSDTTTDELTVDTTAPASPTVNALTTSDTSPVLTGTAEAGSTVTVVINGVTFTTTADSSGNWSVDTGSDVPTSGGPFTALNDGDYDVTVTSTDASGNSSSDTTTDELTVDRAWIQMVTEPLIQRKI